MANQSFLLKQAEKIKLQMEKTYEYQRYIDFRFIRQVFADLSQAALYDAFEFTPEQIEKFVKALEAYHDEFATLWNADEETKEYTMVKLDQLLEPICGDKFMPFEERYKGCLNSLMGETQA